MTLTTTHRAGKLSKADFDALASFRYQLRQSLRFSEDLAHASGITPHRYQLMLQNEGYPGRDWASVTESAERLQAKHHGVVALVSRGESLGLVRRQSSEVDLRQVDVRLPPERCIDALARVHHDELEPLHGLLTMSVRAPRKARGG